MAKIKINNLDIFLIEDTLLIVEKPTGFSVYDFQFSPLFMSKRVRDFPDGIKAIGRFGASDDYKSLYFQLKDLGIELINSPTQHLLCSELPQWYPLIKDLTPKSVWYNKVPNIYEIEKHFSYPLFIKGARQTAKHNKHLSIANSREELTKIIQEYQKNPILHWQEFVCREFIPLKTVGSQKTEKIAPAFEFRTFWWHGQLVGQDIIAKPPHS